MEYSDILNNMITVIKSCDSVILSTIDDQHPDARHVTNMINRDTDNLELFFMTGADTPKYEQLDKNPNCCLYYYNDDTHMSVRLYGKMRFVDDIALKTKYWMPEFKAFGYCGPDDQQFVLMRFIPMEYKFYIDNEIQTGKINL